MQADSSDLWDFLETMPAREAAFCEWKDKFDRRCGFEQFAAKFLQPTNEKVAAVECLKSCGELCCRKVVELAADEILAVCPENERPPYELTRRDIIVYKLKEAAFARSLCKAFGFEYCQCKINANDYAWPLGDYVPHAGRRIPAKLVFARSSEHLLSMGLRILAVGKEQILIVPTRRFVCHKLLDLVKSYGCILLVLTEILALRNDGDFEAVCRTGLLFDVFDEKGFCGEDQPLEIPSGTTWQQMTIEFIDGHTVSVRVGQIHKRLSYGDMGMEDKRTKNPNGQWRLLQKFAEGRGVIRFGSITKQQREYELARLASKMETDFGGFSIHTPPDKTTKTGKKALSNALKEVFGLPDDPIAWKDGAYICRFKIGGV